MLRYKMSFFGRAVAKTSCNCLTSTRSAFLAHFFCTSWLLYFLWALLWNTNWLLYKMKSWDTLHQNLDSRTFFVNWSVPILTILSGSALKITPNTCKVKSYYILLSMFHRHLNEHCKKYFISNQSSSGCPEI
jgi:hypothetical protein